MDYGQLTSRSPTRTKDLLLSWVLGSEVCPYTGDKKANLSSWIRDCKQRKHNVDNNSRSVTVPAL